MVACSRLFPRLFIRTLRIATRTTVWRRPTSRIDFRTNGTYALPIGPNKLLFGKTSGWVARTIEGWQASFIANMTSGNPVSIIGGNTLYANGSPDVVGAFSSKSTGKVVWNGATGNYFGTRFGQVQDPQCATGRFGPDAILHAAGGYGCKERTDSFFRMPAPATAVRSV